MPKQTKHTKRKRSAPWITNELKASIRKKRQAERKWRKSGHPRDRQTYVMVRQRTKELTFNLKAEYYNNSLQICNSSKELYKICNELLGKTNSSPVLPDFCPTEELCDVFATFFEKKIEGIRDSLKQDSVQSDVHASTTSDFSTFSTVSLEHIKNIISKSPKKTCKLDPLPISLLTFCLDSLLPHITRIINTSLQSGNVPLDLKEAHVSPILKKPNLDQNVLKNYRPISNLPFLAKVMERVVITQLNDHLKSQGLLEKFQSAYKTQHSTETALLKVQTDLLNNIDKGQVSVLALLDLSAAFDTIDHQLLITRLHQHFGLSGSVLSWFESYLSGRIQKIVINDHQSQPMPLKYGVPQGSVLGPVLFSLYIHPLSEIIEKHNFSYHIYADDSQLYKSSHPSNIDNIASSLNNCIEEIASWMNTNKLKLNEEKTEILLFGTTQKLKKVQTSSISICNTDIPIKTKARNLGVIFDSQLSMDNHVSTVRKTCYTQLRRIAHIRQYITEDTTKKLVCSFVTPHLDYCNSLLTALPNNRIAKLQQIQNSAARLVKQINKKEHITPILRELHWLPIRSRIDYKIATITFKCINDPTFPSYLRDLISYKTTSRTLRSSSKNLLSIPKTSLRNFGDRAFTSYSPRLWNDLPHKIRDETNLNSFQTSLKTHLFKLSYSKL